MCVITTSLHEKFCINWNLVVLIPDDRLFLPCACALGDAAALNNTLRYCLTGRQIDELQNCNSAGLEPLYSIATTYMAIQMQLRSNQTHDTILFGVQQTSPNGKMMNTPVH